MGSESQNKFILFNRVFLFFTMIAVFALDDHLSRADFFAMPQQTLMEMMIEDIPEKNRYQDNDGGYRDIEDWDGLQFTSDGKVRMIQWRDYMGSNFPAGGTIYLKWLPKTVDEFAVTGSNLEGTVDLAIIPEVMKRLYLQRNLLSGTIDLTCLPDSMTTLILHGNQFTGTISLTKLPPKMLYLQ